MSPEEKTFALLLETLAKKEKKAQKRASIFTAITLVVGLSLMAILFYEIVRLRATRAGLEQEIRGLEIKKAQASHDLAETDEKLAVAKDALVAAKGQLGKGPSQGPAQALTKVTDALNTISATKDKDVLGNGTLKPEVVKPEKPIVLPQAKKSGFINDLEYVGYDKTRVTVTITPLAAKTPRTLFTYAIDGKNYFETPPDRTVGFTLDKTKSNPSKLVLFLDFVKDEPGGFAILIQTSDGNQRRINVSPPKDGEEKQVHFSFAVL